MKNKVWLFQLPFVLIFTFAFYVTELGVKGELMNPVLREKVFPTLHRVSTMFTDWKFRFRGAEAPRNKIVIVEIDSPSLETLGRWPWHRDVTAALIQKVFDAGAKVVGLDIVFSEPDKRVPDELYQILQKQNLGPLADQFETDRVLESVIGNNADRLVIAWTSESACQPLYLGAEGCPVTHPDAIATHPPGFDKFACNQFHPSAQFDPSKSPMMSVVTFIASLNQYNATAKHAGFLNSFPDHDSLIRRTSLLMLANGKAYPSLPLEMAKVGLNEEIKIELDEQDRIRTIGLAHANRNIPVTPLGAMEINFRGPGRTFQYVSALDILSDTDTIKDEVNRKLAGVSKKELLKDAYVLIGLSALGVFDMRAFPFDNNVAGVEGHANILDNLLTGDPLLPGVFGNGSNVILFLMIVAAILFSILAEKLEAVPALLLFLLSFAAFGVVDMKLLFSNNLNWNTSFFYLEISSIFIFTLAIKYVIEERSKKFIHGAFSKYLAPALVNEIIRDPGKLKLGGEKRELTIMFSDIRGFTTFSERLDAKALASFLNDYLSLMTELVYKNNGTLDKYIGDAVMAFWGAPLDQPAHAANAAKTAVQMMKVLAENRERFRTTYGIDVQIGIGINSGMVNVGNMGSSQNFEYTVIGDHVNLASRLEGLTKPYGASIVTTRFTFDDIVACGEVLPPHRVLDHVKVKGKKKAVELLQVLDRDYPEEALTVFEEGRLLYEKQQWDQAITKFQLCASLIRERFSEKDGPSEMYIERCEEFKKTPPEPDWDGSWEMHSK